MSNTGNEEDITAMLNNATSIGVTITIPSEMILPIGYDVSLTVVNFLGLSASGFTSFKKSTNPNIPHVNVVGSLSQQFTVNQMGTLIALGSVSKCATNTYLSYGFVVYDNYVNAPDVASISSDPRRFKWAPYTFKVYKTYQIVATVTTLTGETATIMTTVYISPSTVKAVILGGLNRVVPLDIELDMDGSTSYDNNLLPGSNMNLRYSWSCSIVSLNAFGQPCSWVFTSHSVLTSKVVSVTNLWMNFTYAVSLQVTSNDGRTDSTFCTLTPAPIGTALVTISSSLVKVNYNSKLTLFGSIKGAVNQSAYWNVDDESLFLPNITSTPLFNIFKATDVMSGVVYPLAISPNSLVSGKTYTFTLYSTDLFDSRLTSYGSITLTVNSPPTSGSFQVFNLDGLKNGTAMQTQFKFSCFDWVTLPSNYPLSYSFSYLLSPTSQALVLVAENARPYTISVLAAGLAPRDFVITCVGDIYDNYGASTEVNDYVTVLQDPDFDPVKALNTQLKAAFAANDVDKVQQAVNNVAAFISHVNCSKVPDCSFLARQPCESTPQTCGPCLPGYIGIVGDSNIACAQQAPMFMMHHSGGRRLAIGGGSALIGDYCFTGAECLYGYCVGYSDSAPGVCADPMKVCPTHDPELVCSGHGICSYTDVSGEPVSTCLETDVYCSSVCVCSRGYGGSACSYNTIELAQRNEARISICTALLNVTDMSDPSPALLISLAASLKQSYDPAESPTGPGAQYCTEALTRLSNFLGAGYLAKAGTAAAQMVGQTISLFVRTSTTKDINCLNGICVETYTPTSAPTSPVDIHEGASFSAVHNLQQGIIKSMVGGETPATIVSNGVRISAHRSLASDLGGSGLSPPQTEAEAQYATPGPAIILPKGGLSHCGLGGSSYSQLSVMQWGVNPFGNSGNISSTNIKSPILRFSNKGPAIASNFDYTSTSTSSNDSDPYYIILQLTKSSTVINATTNSSIQLIPDCKLPSANGYEDCPCNVSSVSATNVTYVCYDTSFLCPKTSRRLDTSEDDDESSYTFSKSINDGRRRLSEDELTDDSSQSSSSSDYGALLAAIANAAASVLSQNPFAVDWANAQAALFLVGSLIIAFTSGAVFFKAWDRRDRNALLYLSEKPAKRAGVGIVHGEEQGLAGDYLNLKTLMYRKYARRFALNFLHSKSGVEKRVKISNDDDDEAEDVDEDDRSKVNYLKPGFDESTLVVDPRSYRNSESAYLRRLRLEKLKDRKETKETTTEFLDEIFPESTLIKEDTSLQDFLACLGGEHDYICAFTFPSMQLPRYVRWIGWYNDFMCTALWDTLFFMITFPSGVCEPITEKHLCLEVPSQLLAGTSLCMWTRGGQPACSLAPPPDNFILNALIMVFLLVFSLPWSVFLWQLYIHVVSCRPDFESLGLDTEYWFGRGVQPLNDPEQAGLAMLLRSEDDDNLVVSKRDKKYGTLSQLFFTDFVSVSSEVEHILKNVQALLEAHHEGVGKMSKTSVNQKRMRAVIDRMYMFDDGSPDVNFKSYMMYGVPRYRLERRIARARKQCSELLERLDRFDEGDYNFKDKMLLQAFILEQFSFVKRVGLSHEFFDFDEKFPGSTEPIGWILSWAIIYATLFFCLYWTLMWAVKVGPESIAAWKYVFLLTCVQDALAVCPMRIYVLFGLTLMLCKSQLKDVYQVLKHAASMKMQDGYKHVNEFRLVQHFSGSCRAARASMNCQFPAARLLMTLDDTDIAQCRRKRELKIPFLAFVCLCTPIAMSILGDLGGEFGLNMVMPIYWSFWCVGNNTLNEFSPVVFVFFWIIAGVFVLHKLHLLDEFEEKLLIYKEVRYALKMHRRAKKFTRALWTYLSFKQMYKLTKAFFRAVTRKAPLSFLHDRIWKNFNRPYWLHAHVIPKPILEEIQAKEARERKDEVDVPSEIAAMASKHFSLKWKHRFRWPTDLINKLVWGADVMYGRNKSLVRFLFKQSKSDVSDEKPDIASKPPESTASAGDSYSANDVFADDDSEVLSSLPVEGNRHVFKYGRQKASHIGYLPSDTSSVSYSESEAWFTASANSVKDVNEDEEQETVIPSTFRYGRHKSTHPLYRPYLSITTSKTPVVDEPEANVDISMLGPGWVAIPIDSNDDYAADNSSDKNVTSNWFWW